MALSDPLVVGADSYDRVGDGYYILDSSTTDEPETIDIKSTLSSDKVSSVVVKFSDLNNSSESGAPDSLASAHVVLKWSPERSITDAESMLTKLKAFLTTANLTKLSRGNR